MSQWARRESLIEIIQIRSSSRTQFFVLHGNLFNTPFTLPCKKINTPTIQMVAKKKKPSETINRNH
jgi:hypothetical protein